MTSTKSAGSSRHPWGTWFWLLQWLGIALLWAAILSNRRYAGQNLRAKIAVDGIQADLTRQKDDLNQLRLSQSGESSDLLKQIGAISPLLNAQRQLVSRGGSQPEFDRKNAEIKAAQAQVNSALIIDQQHTAAYLAASARYTAATAPYIAASAQYVKTLQANQRKYGFLVFVLDGGAVIALLMAFFSLPLFHKNRTHSLDSRAICTAPSN